MNLNPPTLALETDLRPVAALATSIAVLTLCALGPAGAAWKSVALPFALMAPGYAVVVALFVSPRLDRLMTLCLSVVLSLALYPLLTLTLWAIEITPTPLSVAIGTDAFITVLVVVGLMRALPRRGSSRLVLLPIKGTGRGPSMVGLGTAGLVAFFLLLACALAFEERLLPAAPGTPYTAFALAGRWADAARIAGTSPNGRLAVRVTVVNRTHSTQTYRVVPLAGNIRWHVRLVRLRSGGRWTGTVGGQVAPGCLRRLRISLHQQGTSSRSAVGRLTLWVSNAPSPHSCSASGG